MLDTIISLFAPYNCLACGKEGRLLCFSCVEALPTLPQRCYKCQALSAEAKTCQTCRRSSALYSVQVATPYRDVAKDLVWKLKFAHARSAVNLMSTVMTDRLHFSDEAIIVHVPTATGRVRQRGFDQAQLLAVRISRTTSLRHSFALARHGQERQVGSSRKQRLEHLLSAFWVRRPELIAGKHIILIDDVITTGATLEAAASVLRQAGAKRVDAVVFAQA